MSIAISFNSIFNFFFLNKTKQIVSFKSALKWAIAAGRPDLLEKKINCITKYYLCSEHFTKDCFMDPPANTRLKKKINPVCIPIPSIFKCNIDRYLPINAKSKPINEEEDDHRTLTNDGFLMNKAREGISLESLSVFHDHYNYLDMSSCAASFLNNIDDISLTMNDLSNENTFENIAECNPIDIESSNTCRLCANMFLTSETLVELSSKPELCKRINVFIPNMVS